MDVEPADLSASAGQLNLSSNWLCLLYPHFILTTTTTTTTKTAQIPASHNEILASSWYSTYLFLQRLHTFFMLSSNLYSTYHPSHQSISMQFISNFPSSHHPHHYHFFILSSLAIAIITSDRQYALSSSMHTIESINDVNCEKQKIPQ